MSRIRGSYPGGPGRESGDTGDAPRRTRRLRSAEEIDARIGSAVRVRHERSRRRRAWSVLAAAIVAAGGAGLYLGFRAHRSAEQLTSEREAERTPPPFDITRETNRMLIELWRMEDVERQDRMP